MFGLRVGGGMSFKSLGAGDCIYLFILLYILLFCIHMCVYVPACLSVSLFLSLSISILGIELRWSGLRSQLYILLSHLVFDDVIEVFQP